MTRLPDGVVKPAVVRMARGDDGDLVVELAERCVTIRPKFSRDKEAAVTLNWQSIYNRGLMAAAELRRAAKRRGRT